jgi:hypothetical protein
MVSIEEYTVEAANAAPAVKAIAIVTVDDYTNAGQQVLKAKALLKRSDEIFDPVINATNKAHKESVKVKKDATAGLAEAIDDLGRRMSAWKREQDQIAADALAKADRERMDREKMAREAEAQGDAKLAAEVRAVPVAAAPVVQAAPKIAGIVERTTYRAVVTEPDGLMKLVQAIAAGTVHIRYVEANMVELNAKARADKWSGAMFPGVESVESSKSS